MTRWLTVHRTALIHALRTLRAQLGATLFTALALGVALSLPAGLYLALAGLEAVSSRLPTQPELSVYLDDRRSPAQNRAIADRLKGEDIAEARFIGKDEALAALTRAQGLTDLASGLPENPLPDTWIVQPARTDADSLTRLAESLSALPGVESVHHDHAWALRLAALNRFGTLLIGLLAVLFGIALAAIAGNAIRAQVLARRDEILVSRLIGATDHYVRRPFLYSGAFIGLMGGLAALGVLAAATRLLTEPLTTLGAHYLGDTPVELPWAVLWAALLGLPTAIAWLGAWVAVTLSLRRLDSPQ